MRKFSVIGTVVAAMAAAALPAQTASAAAPATPTVVLVHGAWEQGSSWEVVAERLRDDGYRVVVPEIALRTLAGDVASVARVVERIDGPTVLAGHSYGGMVISNAAEGVAGVKALVYIAAFAPEPGESTFGLDSRVPGSLLPASIVTVPFTQGALGLDVYINPLLFGAAMAHDLPAPAADMLAAQQRPITLAALMEPSVAAAWKSIASWYLVAAEDRAIPPQTERFMAKRAKATTVEVASSHVAHVSHPDAVTDLIRAAARSAGPPPSPAAVVTGLRLSPGAFRAARSGPAVRAAAAKTGSRVSYTLNVPASVRFTVQRSSSGRTVAGSCVKASASNRGRRSCTRLVAVRSGFTRTRPAGADRFRFTARLSGRALRPARYRLVATPIATANGRSGNAARAPFRVIG